MSAITLGIDEIRDRLALIRRRFNLFNAQHVLYVNASILSLAGAALVCTALAGTARQLGLAVWISIGAIGTGLILSFLKMRRRWLSLENTAQLADRRARLEDRLTTLISTPPRDRPSRLRPLLVAQVLSVGNRWSAEVLVPRRIPWSLYFCLASLALFAATLSIDPPVESTLASRSHSPNQEPSPGVGVPRHFTAPEGAEASGQPNSGKARSGRGGLSRNSGNGNPVSGPPARSGGSGAPATGRGGGRLGQLPSESGRALSSGAGSTASRADPRGEPIPLPDRLQRMIRRAVGAPVGEQSTKQRGPLTPNEAETSANLPGRARAGMGETKKGGGARRSGPTPGTGLNTGATRQAGRKAGQGGGKASGGAATTGGKGLFGQQTASTEAPATHPLSLRLGTFSASGRTALERPQDPVDTAVLNANAADDIPLPRIAEGRADLPLERPMIPEQHEGILRRIFTRGH